MGVLLLYLDGYVRWEAIDTIYNFYKCSYGGSDLSLCQLSVLALQSCLFLNFRPCIPHPVSLPSVKYSNSRGGSAISGRSASTADSKADLLAVVFPGTEIGT
jgi:hypothetical protein